MHFALAHLAQCPLVIAPLYLISGAGGRYPLPQPLSRTRERGARWQQAEAHLTSPSPARGRGELPHGPLLRCLSIPSRKSGNYAGGYSGSF